MCSEHATYQLPRDGKNKTCNINYYAERYCGTKLKAEYYSLKCPSKVTSHKKKRKNMIKKRKT